MLLALVILAVAAAPQAVASFEALAEWEQFKLDHGKAYDSPEEEMKRFDIFQANLEKAAELNAKYNGSATFGATQFSDLTHAEFQSTMLMDHDVLQSLMENFTESASPHDVPTEMLRNVPASVDWRRYVGRIKHQGRCQSCYVFAAVAAVETHKNMYSGGKFVDLSEQQVVDCAKKRGCHTGWMDEALKYIHEKGVMYSDYYPYVSINGLERTCANRPQAPHVKIRGYRVITTRNEEDVKNAIAIYGPVAVPMDADTYDYAHYKKGILSATQCNFRTSHAVLAVGYGTENGEDYWIMKNSYGPHWGERGYFRMARNVENRCSVATRASYPMI